MAHLRVGAFSSFINKLLKMVYGVTTGLWPRCSWKQLKWSREDDLPCTLQRMQTVRNIHVLQQDCRAASGHRKHVKKFVACAITISEEWQCSQYCGVSGRVAYTVFVR